MNQSEYILSICIPTYNREKYLKRLIDSIVNQKGFTNEVSIVINDGPSKDNTTQMVAEYQKKYKNITYFRNNVAVGMLPAILESIEMSDGEYTWLFGSDDFMQEDSLEIVMDILKNKAPTMVLSNRFTFTDSRECNNYKEEERESLYFQWFTDFWIYLWLDEKEKYEDKHNYFTFMSVFCFETIHYKKMLQYVTKNICSASELNKHYFNYIVVLFSQLFSEKTICIIEKPRLVFCQADNHNWKHNKKIAKDIKMLSNYMKNTYVLPSNTLKMLDTFVFRWWLMCNVATPAKLILSKVWLYEYPSYLWRKYFLKRSDDILIK